MNSEERKAFVLIAEVERYLRLAAQSEAWRAELETADYGDDPVTEEIIAPASPVRATFADGTEARHLNVGRLGLCGPEAMRRAIEREEER